MPEPQAAVISLLMSVVTAPTAKEYAVICVGAVVGALWPLSDTPTATRMAGAKLMFRLVTTAMVLTGAGAWLLEKKVGLPSTQGLWVVSFAIAAIGNRWRSLIAATLSALLAGLKAFTTKGTPDA